MSRPTTKAGLALYSDWDFEDPEGRIEAIEREAAAAERARLQVDTLAAAIAYWCFSEDDSGDDTLLVAAYDALPEDIREELTEERIGALVDALTADPEPQP